MATVWRTFSISVPGNVAFRFAVQSLPIVPFSLNTTNPSLLYFAVNGVSENCDLRDRILGAKKTEENIENIEMKFYYDKKKITRVKNK